nr:uncharacterized protein LOC109167856 [Ipomoea batatas]
MGVPSKFEFDEEGDEDMDFPEMAGKPGIGISLGSSNQSIKGPMDLYFNKKEHQSLKRSKGGESVTLEACKKELRERAIVQFSRWILQGFIECVAQHGPGMKPPSYHEVRVPYLKKEVEHVKELFKPHEETCNKYDCSLMVDKWTDRRELFETFVNQVEKDNVVQVISDNASENVRAGKDLMEVFPSLYWTPCAAHCINLMFKDIFEIRHFSMAYKRALKLSTRFATTFLTFKRLHEQKNNLRKLFNSEEFLTSSYFKEEAGRIDGDVKSSMGYIYPAMEITKQAIERAFNNNSSKYKKIFEIIDRRWSSQLRQPLHAAAYYLNPDYFRYRSETPIAPSVHSGEVVNGFYECLDSLVLDRDLHEKITEEMITWEVGTGLFGLAVSKKQRGSKAPGVLEDANDELAFEDGDGLTWGEIAKFSGANETPYSIRHTSKGKEKVGSSSSVVVSASTTSPSHHVESPPQMHPPPSEVHSPPPQVLPPPQVRSPLPSPAAPPQAASSPHPRRRLLQAASCLSSGAASSMASCLHPRRRLLQAASCSSSSVASASTTSPFSSSVLLIKWRRLCIHGVAFSSSGVVSSSASASSNASDASSSASASSTSASASSSAFASSFSSSASSSGVVLIKQRRLLIHGVTFFKQRPAHQLVSHQRRRLLQAASCLSSGAASSIASSPHSRRRLLQAVSYSSSGVASASTTSPSSSSVLLVKWRRILNGIVSSSTASPSSSSVLLIKWRRLRIHDVAFFKQCPACQVTQHPQWHRLFIHGVAFFKQRPAHQVVSHPRRRLLQAMSCLSSGAASSMASSSHPRRRLLQAASCSTSGVASCSSSRVACSVASSPHPRRCLLQRRLLVMWRRILSGVVSASTALLPPTAS